MSNTLRQRFQAGIAFNFVGAVFNQGSTFAFSVVAANLLGRATYGKFATVQTTISAVAQISQLGCGITATRYVAELRTTDPQRASRVISLLRSFTTVAAAVCALSVGMGAHWLAAGVLKAADLYIPLLLAAGVVFLSTVNGLLLGILAGLEAFRRIARTMVICGTAYLLICTALCRISGLNGAVAGLFVSALVQWCLLERATRKERAEHGLPRSNGAWTIETPILIRFALPACLSGLTTMPAIWIANTLLARSPGGFGQVALYGASYALMTAALFVPNVANVVGTSILNVHGPRSDGAYRRAFRTNLLVASVAVFSAAILICSAGPYLLAVFGKDFRQGYPVLVIMMGATVIQGVGAAIYQRIYTEACMWLSFFAIALPRDAMLVVLAYFLVPTYGAMGLAEAYLAVSILAFLSTITIAITRQPQRLVLAKFANTSTNEC